MKPISNNLINLNATAKNNNRPVIILCCLIVSSSCTCTLKLSGTVIVVPSLPTFMHDVYADYVNEKWPDALVKDKILKKLTQKCTDYYNNRKELRHTTP